MWVDVPVIQALPVIDGMIAGLSASFVSASMRPVKRDSMIERPMNRSPGRISPLACNTAISAEQPVPVGERSILPGLMTQAFRLVSVPDSRTSGPVRKAKEIRSHPESTGWRKPSCSCSRRKFSERAGA